MLLRRAQPVANSTASPDLTATKPRGGFSSVCLDAVSASEVIIIKANDYVYWTGAEIAPVGMGTRYGMVDLEFKCRQRYEICLFYKTSTWTPGPTQLSIQPESVFFLSGRGAKLTTYRQLVLR
jgi:hypothetical protein